MSNMEAARQLLVLALAECESDWGSRTDCAEAIKAALTHMKRENHGRVAPKSTPMTKELAETIRQYHRDHPDSSFQEIANIHNVNLGRVSEAVRGLI